MRRFEARACSEGGSGARAAHARRSPTFVAYAIRLNAEKVTKGHTQSSMGPGKGTMTRMKN